MGIALIAGLLLAASPSAPVQPAGYAGIPWGASYADVRAKFPKLSALGGDAAAGVAELSLEVAGFKAEASFLFLKGALEGVMIDLPQRSPAEALEEFDHVEKGLVAKYGPPSVDDTHRHGPANLRPVAFAAGAFVVTARWELKQTLIVHELNSPGPHSHVVAYVDARHPELLDAPVDTSGL